MKEALRAVIIVTLLVTIFAVAQIRLIEENHLRFGNSTQGFTLKTIGSTEGVRLRNWADTDSLKFYVKSVHANALFAADMTITGNALFNTGDILSYAHLKFMASRDIYMNTDDGSDTEKVRIGGGGAIATARGSQIELNGNENAQTGKVIIRAGNVTSGTIDFYTGTSKRIYIDESGGFEFVSVKTDPSSGVGWFYRGENSADADTLIHRDASGNLKRLITS